MSGYPFHFEPLEQLPPCPPFPMDVWRIVLDFALRDHFDAYYRMRPKDDYTTHVFVSRGTGRFNTFESMASFVSRVSLIHPRIRKLLKENTRSNLFVGSFTLRRLRPLTALP